MSLCVYSKTTSDSKLSSESLCYEQFQIQEHGKPLGYVPVEIVETADSGDHRSHFLEF